MLIRTGGKWLQPPGTWCLSTFQLINLSTFKLFNLKRLALRRGKKKERYHIRKATGRGLCS
jgi:hypothetical protein